MRELIVFECQECKRRNYTSTRDKKNSDRLELSKYCKFCRKHTLHKERK